MKNWLATEGTPFLSVLIIVASLFTMVFIKTEVRRLGYEVWRETKIQRQTEDDLRKMRMEYAQLIRPERIRTQALSKLTLGEAKKGQVIQLLGDRFAIPQ